MSVTKRIALFGGSFDPPTSAHREIVAEASTLFDEVVVVPCGPRPDKLTVNDIPSIHRAVMVDMTFEGIPKVTVDLTDLELTVFTRTYQLVERYASSGEVWIVVGSDLILGGRDGRSTIHREWVNGESLWANSPFLVVSRGGYDFSEEDLPPRSEVIRRTKYGASSEIRNAVFNRSAVPEGHVLPRVSQCIDRYGLYRGQAPATSVPVQRIEPRVDLICDPRNEDARKIAAKLEPYRHSDPNVIVTVGGDGTMLHAIRSSWRRRLPFIGINAGHRGFLLNQPDVLDLSDPFSDLTIWHLPLLYVETQKQEGGPWEGAFAFNDSWVERQEGQTAWVEVRVNDEIRIPRLVCDGVLVATAAGSTAYAHAMGAPALPVGVPALVLVGSNVTDPPLWEPVVLPLGSTIEFRSLESNKRPIRGYMDGEESRSITAMRIRTSRVASVELAFARDYDVAEKLSLLQFPQITT